MSCVQSLATILRQLSLVCRVHILGVRRRVCRPIMVLAGLASRRGIQFKLNAAQSLDWKLRKGMNSAKAPFEFQFTSTDGLPVACCRWDCRGPSRGIVQIAHGLGEHIGRYLGLIEVLAEAGLVVYGNDHRGHGRTAFSSKHFADFGVGGFRLLVEDMVRLSAIAKEENSEKPFILLAHSMGSFAAQQYILDHSYSIDGLAL